MKKFITRSLLLIFLFFLIRFSTISIAGASSGLMLWYQSIVPALLPAMILSSLIVQTGAADYITILLQPLTKRLFLHSCRRNLLCINRNVMRLSHWR